MKDGILRTKIQHKIQNQGNDLQTTKCIDAIKISLTKN